MYQIYKIVPMKNISGNTNNLDYTFRYGEMYAKYLIGNYGYDKEVMENMVKNYNDSEKDGSIKYYFTKE